MWWCALFAEQAVSGAVQGIWMAAYDSLAVFALLALAAFGAAGGGEGLPEARQSKPALLVWLLAFFVFRRYDAAKGGRILPLYQRCPAARRRHGRRAAGRGRLCSLLRL